MRPAALFTLLAACSSGIQVPADRPILSWTGTAARDRNRALLPKGFTAPDPHVCAQDTTRPYLGELFTNGLDNPQVNWHWAPVVAGPQQSAPTLNQPEFSLAGEVAQTDDSTDDVLADHPFGTDVDVDVSPDPDFAFLPYQHLRSTMLHTEVETRIFPRAALGYAPQTGDRALMRGVWVLDCGHPPYGAEMHPPTFMTYARKADDRTTVAAAVVVPYRSTLLFSGDPTLSTAFGDTARYSSGLPFPQAMLQVVQQGAFGLVQRLTTHGMMQANRFDTLDFLVCAPLPRPPGAKLQASWRFTLRSGVHVQATQLEGAGCARFVASMDVGYAPLPLDLQSGDWTWQQLSDSASSQLATPIDVRQALIAALQQKGVANAANAPAFQPQNPPAVDVYAALQTRAGADQDAPTALDTRADDQPFPIYGRVRVGWSR